MGLFGTKTVQTKTTSVQDCIRIIEGFFRKIGFNPKDQRLPDKDTIGWWVQRGSAVIFILLNDHSGSTTMRIVSPILYLPEENILPLYRRCLEINVSLLNCALGVTEDKVVIVSERPITGLDPGEFEGTLDFLSAVADDLDDKLANEFNARLYRAGAEGI